MAMILVVTNPFGGLSQGDRITDPIRIKLSRSPTVLGR